MRASHLFPSAVALAAASPTVTTINGTYSGLTNTNYGVDSFLGIPFAQPPVGPLRFQVAQPLNTTWNGTRPATDYGNQCVGYGVSEIPFYS
jgi:triacylglycerol lipase